MLNFAQPWMLWGLLAVFLPVAIHLINRWRHKSVPWAAMSFLVKATREVRGAKKLRHYIILAARILAVAALAFALSRPRTSAWLGIGGNEPDNIVIILDRSASMEIRPDGEKSSLREIALEQLKNTMEQMSSSRFFLLESAGGQIVEISSPEIIPTLSETTATDTKADMPTLLEKAALYLEDNLTGRSEIWIASDMQNSNWQPDSGRWELARGAMAAYSGKVSVRILSTKEKVTLNRSIRITGTRIRNNELHISMEVHQSGGGNTAANGQNIPLTISVNGGRLSDSIFLQGETARAEKVLPLPENVNKGHGFVALAHDSNPRDDVSYFTFSQDKPALIIASGDDGESLEILKNMAAPPSMAERVAEVKSREELEKTELDACSLILWEGALPQDALAVKLKEYVEKGGIILFLPGEKSSDHAAEFMEMKWGARQESAEDKIFLLSSWEQEMGPLRDGADGRAIPVDHTRAYLRQAIIGEGLALALWDDESPALLRKVVDKGQILFLGSEPLYEWSNLADGYMLLPLLQRLIEEGVARFSMPNSHDLGTWKLPVSEGQTPLRVDGYENMPRVYDEFTAGVYQLDDDFYAMNRPEAEDIMEELPTDMLRDLFGEIRHTSFESDHSDTESLVSETWRAFYIFMLLMLLLEGILCLPHVLPVNRKTA